MSKFNRSATRPAVSSPVASEPTPSARTFEGGAGYARDTKSELFLLAVSNMVGADTFYERAKQRDDRYAALVRDVAQADIGWLTRFVRWLRNDANMRSASVVAAAEAVRGRLEAGLSGGNREIVDAALARADEPGEFLAYWTGTYGRAIPKPVKRGVADAVRRLYNERAVLKYDTDSKGFRFGDVIDLVHPTPADGKAWQGDLFAHALDRRHGRDGEVPPALDMIGANRALRAFAAGDPTVLLAPDRLREAGMTWEDVLSLAGSKLDKRKLWEAVIPSMGYMALLRNLRNFDQASVSDEVADTVAAKLRDPEQVAKSRQFPFRFLSTYRAAPSLRWSYPLEQALSHSLANVPALPGRSLVLVDRSPSMWMQKFSERSDMPWADAAAVFGAAVALRAEHADLVEFGIDNAPVRYQRGESVLKVVERFRRVDGTDIPSAVKRHFDGHDRVIVVTDEQTRPGWLPSNGYGYGGMPETKVDDLIPGKVPLYMWNFGGYRHGAAPSGAGNRHTFGGLTDAAFRMVPLIEAGRNATWPF
ncbi:MAG: TROVE domain-containing protein [Actinophytocola sp.]|uniref:TROVE domain-containing protein n=1 Tax=Actinophytocola sp. TaxID=1872138 RepID=UPI003D6A6CEE